MKTKTTKILNLVSGALGLFAAVGVKTFLHPCVHEDGMASACAGVTPWAFGLGLGLCLLSLLSLLLQGRSRILLSCALLVGAVLLILSPGVLAPVCGMAEMRCRLVTQPALRVCGILAALPALMALIGEIKK